MDPIIIQFIIFNLIMYKAFVVILALLNAIRAFQGDFTDCYTCSQKDDGQRFICNWGELMASQKNMVACCAKGSQSRYCWDNAYSNCSTPYSEAGGLFFKYCASAKDQATCGNSTLLPKGDKVAVSKTIARSDADQRFDACSYAIKKADNFTHALGFNSVKFGELQNVAVSVVWVWNVDKLGDPGQLVEEGTEVQAG